MTVLQNTVTEPDGSLLSGWLDVALLGSPFRAATQTEVLGPIKDWQFAGGAWSVELVPGLYVVTQRRQDGAFHSRWTVEVPDSGSPVWLADCLVEVPFSPAAVPLLGVASAVVDGSGHLQVTYTDGATVDAGPVVGPQGPPWTGSATEFGQAVADEIEDETGPANASLRAAFVPVFGVHPPTGNAAADTANIIALAQEAEAAGGGIVLFPGVRYPITQKLPQLNGVLYRGTTPRATPTYTANGAWMPDGPVSLTHGTVLVGDGTFSMFEGNATPLGSPGAEPGLAQITGGGVENLGIENVVNGINVGAANLAGVMWGRFRDIYVTDASGWGVQFVNCQHCDFDNIRTFDCRNGQRYANDMPQLTLMTGNSQFGELFSVIPRGDNRLCRGIVFEAVQGALNEVVVKRLQVNAMARTLLTDTLTLTSGSADIAVPDASKYAPRAAVLAGTTIGGFTSAVAYIVTSVNTGANTIRLATKYTATPVTASASGALSATSYGMPCAEIIAAAGAGIAGSAFRHLDLEGDATIALYLENVDRSEFGIFEKPSNGSALVMARSVTNSNFYSPATMATDFDGPSAGCVWIGARGTITGRKLRGIHSGGISLGGGASGDPIPDLVAGLGGFVYPHAGLGQKVFARDANYSANTGTAGATVYTTSVNRTITLPTIADSATPSASSVGVVFEFINAGTASGHVINTDGTQLFNKTTALTSLTIAPGQALKVTAMKDWQGSLWWLAQRSTLATS